MKTLGDGENPVGRNPHVSIFEDLYGDPTPIVGNGTDLGTIDRADQWLDRNSPLPQQFEVEWSTLLGGVRHSMLSARVLPGSGTTISNLTLLPQMAQIRKRAFTLPLPIVVEADEAIWLGGQIEESLVHLKSERLLDLAR